VPAYPCARVRAYRAAIASGALLTDSSGALESTGNRRFSATNRLIGCARIDGQSSLFRDQPFDRASARVAKYTARAFNERRQMHRIDANASAH